MKKYYAIESNEWDESSEIRLGAVPESIDRRAYLTDKWQYINNEKEFISYEKLGEVMPDVYTYNIPLISVRLKEILDAAGVSNVFYKPIDLYNDNDELSEYYLMLVESVDCVVWEKSEHTVSELSGLKKIVGRFNIEESKVGNFKIFKIKGVLNKFWIIGEELKEKIEEAGLQGIKLIEPSEYYGL
jgi:hypothetical protein